VVLGKRVDWTTINIQSKSNMTARSHLLLVREGSSHMEGWTRFGLKRSHQLIDGVVRHL
jgi:hypothetical protein